MSFLDVQSKPIAPMPEKTLMKPNSIGMPKVEKLTDDLLVLVQENEVLNKRARHAEEEMKMIQDKLSKTIEESELKSKTLQQYILRDHAAKLQPDEKPMIKVITVILFQGN